MPRPSRTGNGALWRMLIGSLLGAVFFGWAAVNVVVQAAGDWNERIVLEGARVPDGASGTVSGFVYLYVVTAIGCLVALFFCAIALRSERARSRARRTEGRGAAR